MSGRRTVATLAATLLAGAALGLWLSGAERLRQRWSEPPPDRLVLEVDPGCTPASTPGCRAEGAGARLGLTFDREPAALAPFGVAVTLGGAAVADATAVVVDFEMQGMAMGVNRLALDPVEPGRWQGSAVLPVCATGRRDWLARVQVQGPEGPVVASFPFVVSAPR